MLSKFSLRAFGLVCAVACFSIFAASTSRSGSDTQSSDHQPTVATNAPVAMTPSATAPQTLAVADEADDPYARPPASTEEAVERAQILADEIIPLGPPTHVCFGAGTPPEVMSAFCDANPLLCGHRPDGSPRYNYATRWSGTLGTPRALTWSLVPDGVPITSVSGSPGSELFSRLDSQFASAGGRATWVALIQSCFDRWAELSGVSYTRITVGGNDWDDGASWGTSGGATRGDIRISMVPLDGPSNVLAFNMFPGGGVGGDMVLDRWESWNSSANNYRFMRDIIMHEHGHGLGFEHVCPIIANSNGRLMEPFINTSFDGPQHDEIRAVQYAYGDPFEENDSAAAATDLGSVSIGQVLTPGVVPPPTPTAQSSLLSIDNNGDQDYYKFTTSEPASVSVTVTPYGFTYDSSAQACGTSGADCCSGNIINSLTIADLNFQVISTNGSTVLATAAAQPAGTAESATNVILGAAGTYYVRVYEGNSPTESQLYGLSITIQTASVNQAQISLPNGPPATLTPGVPTTFDVQIDPNDATITPGTEVLVYDYGSGTVSSPLVSIGGNMWEATLPPAMCSDTPEFFISIYSTVAGTSAFVRLPAAAPVEKYQPIVSTGVTNVFSDNGNTDMGWSVSGNATAGVWNRGAPLGGGDRGDPATDADGSGQCWLTDRADGDTDVDGGTTTLTSPVFDLSTGGVISYDYWFNDITGSEFDGDTYVVEVANDAGGTNWTTVRTYTTAAGQWRSDSIDIGSEVGASSTVRIRFSVSDINAGSVVEGGLDAIVVDSVECQESMSAPDAPTGVAATSGDFCDRVTVSWNASAGADDYDLYRNSVDNSGTSTMIQSGVVGTSADDLTAVPGTTYYYWVQACNTVGCSTYSSPSVSGFAQTTPGQVVNVTASDSDCISVQVDWDALAGATNYDVFRNTVDDAGTASMIGSSATTSYSDNTATPDTTYYYFVLGANSCGSGIMSNSDAGTASAQGAAPAGFTASSDRCDAIGLAWDAVSDAQFYVVYRNTANDFGTASLVYLVFTPGIDDATAAANTPYFYWVTSSNGCGEGSPTAATPGLRLGALSVAPNNVAASDDQCGMVRITWDALVGATSYEVFRNTVDDAGTAVSLGTTAAIMFDDNTAAASVTYYYYVSALNACGDGPLSTGDSGVTSDVPTEPQNVMASNDACGVIQVSWDSVAGATQYEVFRNTVDDGGSAVSLGTTSMTNFDDSTVAYGTTYYYFVSASTNCGDTGLSASGSGETGLLGDVNRDGDINGLDVQGIVDAATGTYDTCADLAAPFGTIDNDDIVAFVTLLLGP